jgi:hypothetical protein
MIAPTELTKNYEQLNTPYDTNQLIESLFQKIQYALAFSVAVGQSYGDAMIVNVAYNLVFNTVLFPDDCRTWQVRAAAHKNLDQLQYSFRSSAPLVSFDKSDCPAVWIS